MKALVLAVVSRAVCVASMTVVRGTIAHASNVRCCSSRLRMGSADFKMTTPSTDLVLDAELMVTARQAIAQPVDDSCTPNVPPLEDGVVNFNRHLIGVMKGAIDALYAGRDFQRFYVLETIARVPYFSYLSCLHMYESLGARDQVRRMRTHYAEADNELHHLLIMEHLGGSEAFADRFLAQHLAFGYFWYCVLLYLLHPRAAYHLSELVEEHAYHTYDAFLSEREAMLKASPVPSIAREYYSGDDVLETFMRTGRGRRSLESLYDVFCEVRDDEGEHWRTLINLVQRDELDGPPEGCSVVGTVERQQQRQQQREREQQPVQQL